MARGLKLKQEGYTAVADFMLVNLERDLQDFTKVFRTIDDDFLQAFKEANQALKNASSSVLIKQSQKKTTKEIYEKADAFKEKLSLLKIYIKRAKLEVPLLQETISALQSRNIERVVKNMRELLPFITENKDKIKDMPSDFLSDIPQTIADFEEKNTEQNLLISKGKQTTSEVKPLYNTLYHYISEVAEVGKIVYKNSPKKDDYTIVKILQRMGIASAKKEEKKII